MLDRMPDMVVARIGEALDDWRDRNSMRATAMGLRAAHWNIRSHKITVATADSVAFQSRIAAAFCLKPMLRQLKIIANVLQGGDTLVAAESCAVQIRALPILLHGDGGAPAPAPAPPAVGAVTIETNDISHVAVAAAEALSSLDDELECRLSLHLAHHSNNVQNEVNANMSRPPWAPPPVLGSNKEKPGWRLDVEASVQQLPALDVGAIARSGRCDRFTVVKDVQKMYPDYVGVSADELARGCGRVALRIKTCPANANGHKPPQWLSRAVHELHMDCDSIRETNQWQAFFCPPEDWPRVELLSFQCEPFLRCSVDSDIVEAIGRILQGAAAAHSSKKRLAIYGYALAEPAILTFLRTVRAISGCEADIWSRVIYAPDSAENQAAARALAAVIAAALRREEGVEGPVIMVDGRTTHPPADVGLIARCMDPRILRAWAPHMRLT